MKTILLLFLPFFCLAQSETLALEKQKRRIETGLKTEYRNTFQLDLFSYALIFIT